MARLDASNAARASFLKLDVFSKNGTSGEVHSLRQVCPELIHDLPQLSPVPFRSLVINREI